MHAVLCVLYSTSTVKYMYRVSFERAARKAKTPFKVYPQVVHVLPWPIPLIMNLAVHYLTDLYNLKTRAHTTRNRTTDRFRFFSYFISLPLSESDQGKDKLR